MSDTIDRNLLIKNIDYIATPGGIWAKPFEAYKEAFKKFVEGMPSAEPKIIHCGECAFAEVADPEDVQDGYVCQFHPGSIWFSGSFCSWAKAKTEVSE